jgi:hypothetical protein
MKARYRHHRLILNRSLTHDASLVVQIIDPDGHWWPTFGVSEGVDIDSTYGSALEYGLATVDEVCDSRLAFPHDENQPSY